VERLLVCIEVNTSKDNIRFKINGPQRTQEILGVYTG